MLVAALKSGHELAIWYDPWESFQIQHLERNGQVLIDFASIQAAIPSENNTPNFVLAFGAILVSSLYIRSRVRTRIQ